MLVGEMEHFRLSFLAVTDTHLSGEGEMVLDESRGHCMLFSGRPHDHISFNAIVSPERLKQNG